MHGASLEWLAPDICVVRAGEGHRDWRTLDPWTYSVTVRVVNGTAEFHAGIGIGDRWDNYRSQRAVIRALRAEGNRVDGGERAAR